MILVDTSVWIDHLRSASAILSALLGDGEVLGHPFVLGELALGNLGRRAEILRMLRGLPQADSASHREVLQFVNREGLFGRGIAVRFRPAPMYENVVALVVHDPKPVTRRNLEI